ncbi:MAG: sulfatase-like hydrolase/transferase, partial [Planctomycetes bacterium]|nr:sulfatase-like hydrolase/transferase [Planctomycetota bacterium]
SIKRFNTPQEGRDIYLAMLGSMDQAIGKVLDALKRTGADDNTLIIFFSDNGGAKKNFADNGVLREYKQTVYEGGIRVPFIVRWPGTLPKAAVCNEPVISLDVLPTICAAAGVQLPADRTYDGKNMLGALRGQAKEPLHKVLFWYDGADQWAVRTGRWKLLSRNGSSELYDLDADIGEKHNLATEQPQVVNRLKALYDNWQSQLGEQLSKSKERKRPRDISGNRPRRTERQNRR